MTPSRPGTKSSAMSHAPLRAGPVHAWNRRARLPDDPRWCGHAGCTRGRSPRPGRRASRAHAAVRCQHGDVPDLLRMRRDYTPGPFREQDLAATWLEQFDRWFGEAVAAELPEPNAAVVATADADGAPDARLVLVKGYDEWGFVFGTSYASTKGAQLAANPRAALVFPWHAMPRQVRVAGRVERIGPTASDALWDPRPRGSQLAAAASVQSTVGDGREGLGEGGRVRGGWTAGRSWSSGCGCWTTGPRPARCPGRTPGAATGWCRRGWSSGRAGTTAS